jgi:RNA recognition motif-containing protein
MKLYVGGVSFDTTDDGLRTFFEQAGTVESATVVTDRYSGRSRGFGFVEMSTGAEGLKAIEDLNGKTLDGRTLTVDQARPRSQEGGRPSSGGGGGGGDRRSRW